MRKIWTEEKARELIDYYTNHSSEETGAKFQMTAHSVRTMVSRFAKRYSIPIKNKATDIKWTEEKTRELIDYYNSHTAEETAEKYQISSIYIRTTVSHLSKKYNISKDRKDTTKWTEEKAREFIEFYNNHSVKETAKKYQIGEKSIRAIANRLSKKYNISMPRRVNRWTEEKARELIDYYNSHTPEETAEKYQTTEGTVMSTSYRLSRRYNIPINRKVY